MNLDKSMRKKRRETDTNFSLIKITRCRVSHALIGKSKSSSTKAILVSDIDTCILKYQFTPAMNWSEIEIDHVRPICLFDTSKDGELK